MKKQLTLFLIFMLVYSIQAQNQNLDIEEILGTWKVKSITLTPEDNETVIDSFDQKLAKDFTGTLFIFSPEGDFNLKLRDDVPDYMNELYIIDNSHWKIEDSSNYVLIGNDEDDYSLMELKIIPAKNGLMIYISESPLLLEMIKLNN